MFPVFSFACPRRRRLADALLIGLLLGLLSACGFQLRGSAHLPYQSLYVDLPQYSVLGADLRRQIRANQPELLAEDPKTAEAILQEVGITRDRVIAALNAQGQARQYQLRLRYTFRVVNNKGEVLLPPTQIIMTREVTYDDNQILSKDQEEAFLWTDMDKDLAQQIMRRLSVARLPAKPVDDDDAD
jgi:LPS-assembly lipoprotein